MQYLHDITLLSNRAVKGACSAEREEKTENFMSSANIPVYGLNFFFYATFQVISVLFFVFTLSFITYHDVLLHIF